MTSPVNVDVKLGVNKFNVDEEHPHIVVKADADKQALELLVKACPAGLYKKQDDGKCALRLRRMSGVRHLSHSGAGVGAGTVGIPARHLWCGVPLRLMLV
ncbi:ferredoxin-like protein [Escherichia coli]|nr:ferredoxin-like protein [Escherichia coli]